jgi:trigger factor
MVEKMYGASIFYEEAANILIPDAYADEVEGSDLEVVSQPKIDIVTIEKGQPFVFTAEVALKPEVTLGDYKGVEVESIDVSVSDEDVEVEIKKDLEQNSRTVDVTDRAVEDGDEVTIDFDGYVGGEQFEGGYAEDYSLKIGSHTFIDTFEDQLIGKNIGDDVDVEVTFPDDYHAKELASKPALFKVKVKGIKVKELPELDDEFVSDISEFETVAEYKEDVAKRLEFRKKEDAKKQKEDKVVDKVIENATMEIPDAMVDSQVNQMLQEYAQQLLREREAFQLLMNKVLDASRISAGLTELHSEEYSFKQLLLDIYHDAAPAAAARNLELKADVTPSIPDQLYGDWQKLRQMILYLLNNAVRFTSSGSIKLSVFGKRTENQVHLLVSVKDTGDGFSEAECKRMTEHWSSAKQNLGHEIEESELGLNLVNDLLSLMDSRLQLISEPGEGSEFYFELDQTVRGSESVGSIDFSGEQ